MIQYLIKIMKYNMYFCQDYEPSLFIILLMT